MKLMILARAAAFAAMLFSAGVANAVVMQFTLTGGYSASWQIDANPTPDQFYLGEGFMLMNMDVFPDAASGAAVLTFWHTGASGGLYIYDFASNRRLVETMGPQLYSGTEAHPVFLPGVFTLFEYQGLRTYTLTIAEAVIPAAVPEPATGALLVGGLVLLYARRK